MITETLLIHFYIKTNNQKLKSSLLEKYVTYIGDGIFQSSQMDN